MIWIMVTLGQLVKWCARGLVACALLWLLYVVYVSLLVNFF